MATRASHAGAGFLTVLEVGMPPTRAHPPPNAQSDRAAGGLPPRDTRCRGVLEGCWGAKHSGAKSTNVWEGVLTEHS